MNENNQQSFSSPPTPPPEPSNLYDSSVMSTKDWVITWLIMLIPCVGLVMAFVWAFSGSGNLNRRNYCRAYLIIAAIGIALYLLLWLVMGAAFIAMFSAF